MAEPNEKVVRKEKLKIKNENAPVRAKIKIDTHKPFGAVLEQLMERDRWSGADLAREVECTRNHISEILSGKCFPSFSLGQRIASVFGYELAWRKIPAIPKTPRKKKTTDTDDSQQEPILIPSAEESVAEVSQENPSASKKEKGDA